MAGHAGSPADVRLRVAGNDLLRLEPLERVGPDQEGQVGEALDVGGVVPLLVDEDAGEAQEERRVGVGPHRDPVVRLAGGRAVLRHDADDLGAALHQFHEVVVVGPLVLHEVLADPDVELGEAQLVEVHIRGLQPVDEGLPRRLVAVPGVVGPVPSAPGLVRPHAAHVGVEQRQGVGEAVHAVFPDDAEEPHPAPALEGAGAGPVPVGEHLLGVALGQEPPLALIPAVALGDGHHPLGGIGVGLVPGGPEQLVLPAGVELVLGLGLGGELREAVVRPLLPALADHRVPEPVGAVDAALEGEAVEAAARVPRGRGLVAHHVADLLGVVVLLAPEEDSVAHEAPQPALMRAVGRADPREGRVVAVLVAVHLLPVAGRVDLEGVVHLDRRGEGRERQGGLAPPQHGTRGEPRLQEVAPSHVHECLPQACVSDLSSYISKQRSQSP